MSGPSKEGSEWYDSLHEKMTGLNLPCQLIVVPGIKHSYKNLYAELGDAEFQFYKSLFSGQQAEGNVTESALGTGSVPDARSLRREQNPRQPRESGTYYGRSA